MIVGNLVALVSSTYLTRRLISKFKWSVQQVRAGLPAGKAILDVKRRNAITSIEIPKFVGMTFASFYLNYNIISYLAGGVLSFIFGPWVGTFTQQFGLFNMALEMVLVSLVVVVGLDMIFGKAFLLGQGDELKHPILWTWYVTIMLLFNLAKAAALSTMRIIYMILLNICQFAIIDQSHFPEGFQGMDPAYSSFVALVYFTCKYRHPVIYSLYLRTLSTKWGKQFGNIYFDKELVEGTDGNCDPKVSNNGPSDTRPSMAFPVEPAENRRHDLVFQRNPVPSDWTLVLPGLNQGVREVQHDLVEDSASMPAPKSPTTVNGLT